MTVALAHQVAGSGPPLMILHGLFGSLRNWRSIGRRLEAQFTVVLVDLRNHGQSPHHQGMSYFELAEDVDALADGLNLGSFHLLGHSMGGKTAMRYALDRPDRLSSLCVADISPTLSGSDHGPLLHALKALNLGTLRSRGEADRLLTDTIPDAGLRSFLLQSLANKPAGFEWQLGFDEIEQAMDDLVSFPRRADDECFEGLTLFIRGEASDYVTAAHWPLIQTLFPAATMTTIPKAGHWLHAEQPDAFVSAYMDFARLLFE